MRHPPVDTAPVAIGGIGGSGTRLVASILASLGYDLGPDLNEALDCQLFSLFFKRQALWPVEKNTDDIARSWCIFRKALRHPEHWSAADLHYVQALAREARPRLPIDWLQWRVKLFRDMRPRETAARWGWKEPNTHVFIGELARLEPAIKYIHVVRHGLDMAFSKNQEQLLYWRPQDGSGDSATHTPERSFAFWCDANRRALECGQGLAGNFLLLNFDNFCRSPREELRRLLHFLDCSIAPEAETRLIERVRIPQTVNRYRQQPIDFVTESDRTLLQRMGFALEH